MSKKIYLSLFILLTILSSQAQISSHQTAGQGINTITTAVPFLTIDPESRAGGMGETGAATEPDVYSQHFNASKYIFTDKAMGLSISYTPWLRALIPDINLSNISGFNRLDKRQVIGYSLRYFSLGSIIFTDLNGTAYDAFTPYELAIDGSYALKLSKNMGGAVTLRFIYSNLTKGAYVGQQESHPGKAFAGDVSFYYQNVAKLGEKDGEYAFGINISNMGTKISYTDETNQNFLPTNLKLGGRYTSKIDEYNSLSLALDINKLLVPTPPRYDTANAGIIVAGYDPNVSVPVGIVQSFYDAPGGFKEEMQEIYYSAGLEYWYAKKFAVRMGYFYEHQNKGNRKFFTAGLGLKLNVFNLDFAYLIPTTQRNPLENTLRFSLAFNFDAFKKEN